MLLVTEEAASAIEGLLASVEVSNEAGVRITTERGAAENGAPRAELQLSIAEAPRPNDQVLEHAPVFLEPEAAALLDDKVLDADVAGAEVQFQLKEQT